MKFLSLLACGLFAVGTSACASIVDGQNQALSVNTIPKGGAICKLTNGKGTWYVNNTPGTVTVTRGYDDMVTSCELKGYGSGSTASKSSTKGMAAGNIIFGGIIGGGVDMATGAAYDYPSEITVELHPETAANK
ncbi:hypothetical protein RLW55_05935 [Hyphomicrobium sp. B1]|uniref:hypothetical protein n=1 Tax=Hyphomicrobium sp. B1 TaxID=3075651 RepID=UPI003C2E871F